jgi:hypothetical protein
LGSLVLAASALFLISLAGAPGASAATQGGEAPLLDLSGEWYVLVHYRDTREGLGEAERFRDFAWSIEQRDAELLWRVYPFVAFGDELEEIRKAHMRAEERWEPDPATLARLREELPVSPRAATRERLVGSREAGFRSPASPAPAANTVTFVRDWSVRFEPRAVRVEIHDALGGSLALEEMRETTLFEIQEKIGPGELRGVYREGTLRGTFLMLRARARRVVD